MMFDFTFFILEFTCETSRSWGFEIQEESLVWNDNMSIIADFIFHKNINNKKDIHVYK